MPQTICQRKEEKNDNEVDTFNNNDSHINFNYANDYPNLCNNCNGYIIDQISFLTLMPYGDGLQYLDDGIINGLFSLLPDIAMKKKMELVCFDTQFYDKIIRNGEISKDFEKWAKIKSIIEKNILLIPINYITPKHWTLLVIIFSENAMVFFFLIRCTIFPER